jgi:hypothetical protein
MPCRKVPKPGIIEIFGGVDAGPAEVAQVKWGEQPERPMIWPRLVEVEDSESPARCEQIEDACERARQVVDDAQAVRRQYGVHGLGHHPQARRRRRAEG